MMNKLCINHETILKVLKSIPDDLSYDVDDEFAKEYIYLLHSSQSIHTLFHSGGSLIDRRN